ncbi:MAG: helix-turn-helix domain-containing protein [Nitrospirae bacterium]|nr:helix-turn-helix domain-containing protein [Nitrospirota bacterium]
MSLFKEDMKLLNVNEIAQILNVKPSTVYQWAELGQIPCIKLNGCLRFDLEDILKWIRSCKKSPDSGYNSLTQARGPMKGGRN